MKKADFKCYERQIPIVCSLPGADKTFDAEMVTYSDKGICFTCNPVFNSALAEGQTILFWLRGASLGGGTAPKGPDGFRTLSRARVLHRKAFRDAKGAAFNISVEYC